MFRPVLSLTSNSLLGRNTLAFRPLIQMMSSSTQGVAGTGNEVASTKLSGKIAIVTASTEGIGFAVAKRLALDGASVVVSSRQQKNVDNAVKLIANACAQAGSKGQVRGIVAHVAKSQDRTALINEAEKHFGGLDILVSNAAVSPAFGPILETTEVVWDKIFEINVKDAFMLVKEAAPKLKDRGDGSIIFVSSIAGLQPFKFLGAYSVSKTALLGLTKVLANELADDKIRVNTICPGVVKTKFAKPLWQSPEVNDLIMQQTPLKRIAQPDDISGLVSFLCSKDASYITGENFVIAGGMHSRL